MFRFSIRDLLWLTLVVAVALGWFVRERQHREEIGRVHAQVDLAKDRARQWRNGAGVLEHVVRQYRREVFWDRKGPPPRLREPTSGRQLLHGGWTCPGCGCELDRQGNLMR